MTFLRFGILAAALSLSSCTLSTAPEPPEFKLSSEALSQKYYATRKTGSVRLYAQKIDTTRDEWGRETHVASGGALLVKETTPPIHALASDISLTPEFTEVRGKSTVKKDDRLYLGQDESSKIRIDGGAILPEGPHAVRRIAAEEEPAKAPDAEKTAAEASAPVLAEASPAPPPEPAKVKRKTSPKPKAKPSSSAVAKAPPAKTDSPAKPAAPVAKASPPPVAPQPKAAPAIDRSRLLNLMREPTER